MDSFRELKKQGVQEQELMPLRERIKISYRLALKIRNLMNLATTEDRNKDALETLKKHQSALSKLLLIQRIPKH